MLLPCVWNGLTSSPTASGYWDLPRLQIGRAWGYVFFEELGSPIKLLADKVFYPPPPIKSPLLISHTIFLSAISSSIPFIHCRWGVQGHRPDRKKVRYTCCFGCFRWKNSIIVLHKTLKGWRIKTDNDGWCHCVQRQLISWNIYDFMAVGMVLPPPPQYQSAPIFLSSNIQDIPLKSFIICLYASISVINDGVGWGGYLVMGQKWFSRK